MPVVTLRAAVSLSCGSGGLVTTKVSVAVLVPLALVAETGTVYVPTVVGVPERMPVDGLRVMPGGRPPPTLPVAVP